MRCACLTLFCAVFSLGHVLAQTEDQRKTTAAYVRDCQKPDGGFVPAKADRARNGAARSSLRASTAALRALRYFGGEARDRMACARFVQRCFDKKSGGFADYPGQPPDVTATAVGIMAIAELSLPIDAYRKKGVDYLAKHVQSFEEVRIAAAGLETIRLPSALRNQWLGEIDKLRNADGTYGTEDGVARATGGAVVAVLRLGGKVGHRENVLRALKTGQRADGGFGKGGAKTSDLETSYRVMRAFFMLKAKPDVERLRSFVASCRNHDSGYGVAPGQPSSVAATYFAGTILHWLN